MTLIEVDFVARQKLGEVEILEFPDRDVRLNHPSLWESDDGPSAA